MAIPLLLTGCSLVDALGGSESSADGSVNADALAIDALVADALPDAIELDAAPAVAPSCVGLANICGPSGNEESCCASSVVQGGMFYRDYDLAPDNYNDMSFPATLSDFRLDTYEITVGRFRKFVDAGMGTQLQPPTDGSGAHMAITGSGWSSSWNANLEASKAALIAAVKCNAMSQTWTDSPGANENKPVNCITWYEAMAFCIWDGGYLPTEAEWNYAATGGAWQRAYPWSNPAGSTTIDSTYAVYAGSGSAAKVGSKSPKGDGRWGQADLSGNLMEWTLDWYADPYPTASCTDCANVVTGSYRAWRGCSFNCVEAYLRTAARVDSYSLPTARILGLGARCARAP